jgi:hypothetical protein
VWLKRSSHKKIASSAVSFRAFAMTSNDERESMVDWQDLSDSELRARLTNRTDLSERVINYLVRDRDSEEVAVLIRTALER